MNGRSGEGCRMGAMVCTSTSARPVFVCRLRRDARGQVVWRAARMLASRDTTFAFLHRLLQTKHRSIAGNTPERAGSTRLSLRATYTKRFACKVAMLLPQAGWAVWAQPPEGSGQCAAGRRPAAEEGDKTGQFWAGGQARTLRHEKIKISSK